MVTKSRKNASKKKIKTLNLKKETVRNLTGREAKKVKGGVLDLSLVGAGTGSNGSIKNIRNLSRGIRYTGGCKNRL